jgi:hypothetical protein
VRQDLTDDEIQVLVDLWAISMQEGVEGAVVYPQHLPDAIRLQDRGWLRRAHDDEFGWFWAMTEKGRVAMEVGSLTKLTPADMN